MVTEGQRIFPVNFGLAAPLYLIISHESGSGRKVDTKIIQEEESNDESSEMQ